MSQKGKNSFVSLLLFMVFSGLGLAIGYGVGNLRYYLGSEGFFSSWTLLDGPQHFEKINDATRIQVWAQTSDGKLYYFPTNCAVQADCNKWIETPQVPDNIHTDVFPPEEPVERGVPCPSSGYKYLKNPPGNLVDCARVIAPGMDIMPGTLVYYALLDDGKIWMWSISGSMYDRLLYVVLCSCPGLLLGITTFIIYAILRKKKIKLREKELAINPD